MQTAMAFVIGWNSRDASLGETVGRAQARPTVLRYNHLYLRSWVENGNIASLSSSNVGAQL